MTLLSGHKSFGLGRQQLAFFGVQLILIKQEMGRNVRHICRLLRQLTQDPESRCLFLAELHAHLHVEIFCSSFEWGSLIKSLKSRAFAQYAPLPSLQSTIACNLFTHNEGASRLIRCRFLCLCKHGENSLSTWCCSSRQCRGGHARFHCFKWPKDWWMTGGYWNSGFTLRCIQETGVSYIGLNNLDLWCLITQVYAHSCIV